MNVLIIDDEKDICDSISLILKKKGFNPSAVDNIQAAKKFIDLHKWDLIISDVMIPHLGGFELVDYIKSKSPKTPVILITGMDKSILNATLVKADIVLTKPFTAKQLTGALNKLISVTA